MEKKNTYYRIIKISIFILIAFFLLLILILSLLILYLFFIRSPTSPTPSTTSTQSYSYQELNPLTKQTKHAFARLQSTLIPSSESFLSYHNEETGNYVIISPFSKLQFTCEGTCKCLNSRRSTSVLSKSLFILISALSTSVAIKMAEKTFEDSCLQEYSGICENENIVSEVSKCAEKEKKQQRLNPWRDDPDSLTQEQRQKMIDDATTIKDPKDILFRDFICEGHCVPENVKPHSQAFGDVNVVCEELRHTAVVEVESLMKFELAKEDPLYYGDVAEGKFAILILEDFCKVNSLVEYHVPKAGAKDYWGDTENYSDWVKIQSPTCKGQDYDKQDLSLKNVECRAKLDEDGNFIDHPGEW